MAKDIKKLMQQIPEEKKSEFKVVADQIDQREMQWLSEHLTGDTLVKIAKSQITTQTTNKTLAH